MDIIGWIKGLFTEGGAIEPEVQKTREPRQYEVPTGSAVRVVRMLDQVPVCHEAKYQLWRFLGDRCPETLSGNWKIDIRGCAVWLVEVLP